ncbi:glycosyltransferase family 4 protein [Desulfosoma sp.]
MTILMANKFFFVNGGTDRYFFHMMHHIEQRGHRAVPFSVRHSISRPSPWLPYFLPPPGEPEHTHYAHFRLSTANIIRLADRAFYSIEARWRLRRLLKACGRVDIAYILNIYNYMSPSIIHTFVKHGIPIVMRIGDYHLQCANYLFLRNGQPCVLCAQGQYYHALRYRCVKRNATLTWIRVFSMYLHRFLGLYRHVKAFVVPCRFMKSMVQVGGIPEEKIVVIPSPIDVSSAEPIVPKKCAWEYILYFGRISHEKGLDTLIDAYQQLDGDHIPHLVLLGRDYDGETQRLQRRIQKGFEEKIHFLGFIEAPELHRWIKGSLFTVVPSRWYDNAPMSVYESYAMQRPVVCAAMGGLAEQVEDGRTGRLFQANSTDDLAAALRWMLSDRERLTKMGRRGHAKVLEENSTEKHINALFTLFESLVN